MFGLVRSSLLHVAQRHLLSSLRLYRSLLTLTLWGGTLHFLGIEEPPELDSGALLPTTVTSSELPHTLYTLTI
jgi:hypothetical protein